jgi:hypothetical protein
MASKNKKELTNIQEDEEVEEISIAEEKELNIYLK